ncbi:MAG: phosphoribosylformylglycinamidine synthase subunit PurQ [Lysobacterales bacterium]
MLGAGRGWATSILERPALRAMFEAFLARDDRFAWACATAARCSASCATLHPRQRAQWRASAAAQRTSSRRAGMLEVMNRRRCSSAAWPARASVAISARRGRAEFANAGDLAARVALLHVAGDGSPAISYPDRPEPVPTARSQGCATTTAESTILMPHPERTPRSASLS